MLPKPGSTRGAAIPQGIPRSSFAHKSAMPTAGCTPLHSAKIKSECQSPTITIQIPDALAQRLEPLQNRLP
jgi:hypothetical protein